MSSARLAWAAIALFCPLSWGCQQPSGSVRPPVAARAVPSDAPTTLFPADLDVAVRVDVARLSGALGATLVERLALDFLVEPTDTAAIDAVTEAIASSQVSWLAFRSNADMRSTEKVLISRGNFSDWQTGTARPGFAWSGSNGASWPHFARNAPRVGSFARIYPLDDRLLILATDAQVSALERSFDLAPADSALRPPDRGTISCSARAEQLRRVYLQRFPTVAERFVGAELLVGYVEPRAADLVLEVEAEFERAEQAVASRDVLGAILERVGAQSCVVGSLARAAQLSVFDRRLRLSADLAEPLVQALSACVLGGKCCEDQPS